MVDKLDMAGNAISKDPMDSLNMTSGNAEQTASASTDPANEPIDEASAQAAEVFV